MTITSFSSMDISPTMSGAISMIKDVVEGLYSVLCVEDANGHLSLEARIELDKVRKIIEGE